MLGIVLLFVALFLFFKPKYRYLSYLLYLGFMLGTYGGFGLLTDSVLGVKNKDLAIVYTFVISLYLVLTGQYKLPNVGFIRWYKLFICFLICSIFFSYFYYGFSWIQILQGGRDFLLIFSLPIFMRIKPEELNKLMPILLWITIITSVLYILQVVMGRALMPYGGEPKIDPSTGLVRLYNSPVLLNLFLALTFVVPDYFGKKVNLLRVIFFIALICTLGRTGIFTALLTVILSILFVGKASTLLKTITVLGILFIPFLDMVSSRFEKGGTEEDLSVLSSGAFQDYDSGDGGTMTYRIAWVYERFDYLLDRPLGEQIFGLGLISDSQPIVNKMYDFSIGLIDEETSLPTQLGTPDIAYGNILTKLGFVGGGIYLCLMINMLAFLYKNRRINSLTIVGAAMMIMLFIGSISGSAMSAPKNLSFYFIIIATILRQFPQYGFMKEKDRILFHKIITNR